MKWVCQKCAERELQALTGLKLLTLEKIPHPLTPSKSAVSCILQFYRACVQIKYKCCFSDILMYIKACLIEGTNYSFLNCLILGGSHDARRYAYAISQIMYFPYFEGKSKSSSQKIIWAMKYLDLHIWAVCDVVLSSLQKLNSDEICYGFCCRWHRLCWWIGHPPVIKWPFLH